MKKSSQLTETQVERDSYFGPLYREAETDEEKV